MGKQKVTDEEVKRANREFYDLAANIYDAVDGRRTMQKQRWLVNIMRELAGRAGGKRFLDLGCGSGLLLKIARPFFAELYGIDISTKILISLSSRREKVLCADAAALPFKDSTFDLIGCFAVLHHCLEYEAIFREVYRILKPGGIFYTDHDIDEEFVRRFRLPLRIYRYIFDAERKYRRANPHISKRLYELSEIHSDGVPSAEITALLSRIGFSKVEPEYHWLGLSNLINGIMKRTHHPRAFKSGNAPLYSVIATK